MESKNRMAFATAIGVILGIVFGIIAAESYSALHLAQPITTPSLPDLSIPAAPTESAEVNSKQISEDVYWMFVHDAEPGLYGSYQNPRNVFIVTSETDPSKMVQVYSSPFFNDGKDTYASAVSTGMQDGYIFYVNSDGIGPWSWREYFNSNNGRRIFSFYIADLSNSVGFSDGKREVSITLESDCTKQVFEGPGQRDVQVTGVRFNDSMYPLSKPVTVSCTTNDIGGENYLSWDLWRGDVIKFDGTKNMLFVKLPWGATAAIDLLKLDLSGPVVKGVQIFKSE